LKRNFSILVNSCDSFDDCWNPFFSLFARYWPNCEESILLNTERKNYCFPGLNIRCTRVQTDGTAKSLSWSECLARTLDQIETQLVLYLQDDYFIERPIKTSLITEFVALMVADRSIEHIGLTHFGSQGPFEQTVDERLWKIGKRAGYRISTQAALWQVDTLRSYLRPKENAWMFEVFGSRRSWRRKETFLTVNRDMYEPKKEPIIQYMHTGITKGKWNPQVAALFHAHGIVADFSARGFSRDVSSMFGKMKTLKFLVSDPVTACRGFLGLWS